MSIFPNGLPLPLILAVTAVIAYFCGCFNGAVIVSKYILRNDVRNHGSGNAGLTNFFRTMEGVTRAYFLDKHEEAMRQIVENTAEGLGMKAVLKYAHVVHPVINDDDDLTEIAQKAVVKLFGEETLCHMPAMMGSEDFANYAAEIPAVFGFIGCRDEANGMIYNNHHEKFTVNESLLPKGTALMAQFAVDYLAGNA